MYTMPVNTSSLMRHIYHCLPGPALLHNFLYLSFRCCLRLHQVIKIKVLLLFTTTTKMSKHYIELKVDMDSFINVILCHDMRFDIVC